MTFKLPEPAHAETLLANTRDAHEVFWYTAEQLLQVRRDALEEAAKVCFEAEDSDDEYVSTRHTIANVIRKLKDET